MILGAVQTEKKTFNFGLKSNPQVSNKVPIGFRFPRTNNRGCIFDQSISLNITLRLFVSQPRLGESGKLDLQSDYSYPRISTRTLHSRCKHSFFDFRPS